LYCCRELKTLAISSFSDHLEKDSKQHSDDNNTKGERDDNNGLGLCTPCCDVGSERGKEVGKKRRSGSGLQ
jgi:hypothetical protein